MKYVELLEKNTIHDEDEKYDMFLESFALNTDEKIVDFLFEKPLLRAMKHNPKWDWHYGVSTFPRNRNPKDSPLVIQDLVDEYLKQKGFKALRSNSIFCTSNRNFVENIIMSYEDDSNLDIYFVFPPKYFYFTWNPLVKDFYLENLYDRNSMEFDLFDINYENIENNENVVRILLSFFENYSKLDDNTKEKIKKYTEEKNYRKIIKLVSNYNKDKEYYSSVVFPFISRISSFVPSSEQKKYIILNKNSLFAKSYRKDGFFEAVNSGNEIMITNNVFYYISEEFMNRNAEKIYKDIHEKRKQIKENK